MTDKYYLQRYAGAPGIVFGFHGCSRDVAHKVLHEGEELKDSTNDYDWLGHGKYFWEANPVRALNWATEQCKRKGGEPAVIGACIDLSCCLNLLSENGLEEVRFAYGELSRMLKANKSPMPANTKGTSGSDILFRSLDCVVINLACSMRKQLHKEDVSLPSYTSVRGVFWEGEELYPGAGFKEKNHIQICVTDSRSILCYFHPQCYLKQNLGANTK